jgi:tetratricopeptide (TPR) repeat protein
MANRGTSLRAVSLALLISGCSSTGGFEGPLVATGVLTSEEAGATANEEAGDTAPGAGPVSVNDDPYNIGTDFINYRNDTYRIRDLDPGERPPLHTDEAGLWMQSDRLEQRIRTSGNLLRDAEINAYLQKLTCDLADQYCGDIRVYLSRTPYFNAYMAPNGLMNVWTGLLLRVDNEAQLAAVLAHEIGHYLRRHSVQLFRDVRDKSNAGAFLSVGLGAFGTLTQFALLGSVFAYKRDMEREADGYSLLLMARAGYDPREAHKIWARILKEKEADPDPDDAPFIYATHPPSAERRDALDDLGGKVFDKLGADTIGTERFRAVVAPYKTELLRDEIDLRNFERSLALFDMLLENDPNPAEIIFFKGELYRARDDEDASDAATALDFYDQALAAEGTPPTEIYRAMGLLHRRQGNSQAAAHAFRRYLELEPDTVERPFIESIIEELETS